MMAILSVLLIGGVTLPGLAVDFLPNIERNVISVRTTYRGAGPRDIERLITEPMERALSTINNVAQITSTSREDQSRVRVEFNWGTDMSEAMNDVRDKIGLAKRALPDDAEEPLPFKFDTSMLPVMILTVTGNMPTVDLREYIVNNIQYRLEQIGGVAAVDINGGETREIRVEIDQWKSAALRISIDDVIAALRLWNQDIPGGLVPEDTIEYLLRSKGEFVGPEDVRSVIIKYIDGQPVRISDISTVRETIEEKKESTGLMGKRGLILAVRKQSGENTVAVAGKVHRKLNEIKELLPPGVKIDYMFDTSEMITDSIGQLRLSGLIGSLLAIVVLLIFLRSVRPTVIVFVAIPFSVFSTFIVLYMGGLTLNIMSLGGLALGVGMMVDNSIVVLENIFRRLSEGENAATASIEGASEVSLAITASTATTLCVFVPLTFVGGMSGIFFRELALSVSFSLIASLGIALTLIPMLCSRFLRRNSTIDKRKTLLRTGYEKVLSLCLKHRVTTLLSLTILFICGTVFLARQVGTEHLPPVDESQINISMEMPVGTTLEVTTIEMEKIEQAVRKNVPEIRNMYRQVGSATSGRPSGTGANTGSLRIMLVHAEERQRTTLEIVNSLRPILKQASSAQSWVSEGGSILQRILGGGRESRLEIDIRGYNLNTADQLAREISNILQSTDGATNPRISSVSGRPELRIQVDTEKAARLGLNPVKIGETIRSSIEGTVATRMRREGEEFDVRVQLAIPDRSSINSIENIIIPLPDGTPTPISGLVKLYRESGPVLIERRNQQRTVTVRASYTGEIAPGDVNAAIAKRISTLNIPQGFSINFSGEEEERQEAFKSFLIAFILATALIYMVMASQFESLLHPFLILFSIPFSFFGVFLSLYLTGTTLNLMSWLGIIMLAGIVVNNGIVLIDTINRRRESGLALSKAIILASSQRLRPILMTTMTTCLALIPLAVGLGRGSEMQAPLGRVVAGGLMFSSALTLILIPVLYAMVGGFLLWKKRTKKNVTLTGPESSQSL
jgi:HAE1 family hydrophobic/amphiphilic exporter-1